jgi:hypothetical protein
MAPQVHDARVWNSTILCLAGLLSGSGQNCIDSTEVKFGTLREFFRAPIPRSVRMS